MSDHFSVTVSRNGEPVVTIETNCLSGRDISPADEEAIRSSANTLLGFIGAPVQFAVDCPICGQRIEQVASATLSLALWQHFNWMHAS